MTAVRGAEWNENERRWSMCWLCEAWHTPDSYLFLQTITHRWQSRKMRKADLYDTNTSDILCQKCGGRLCTGPHHGTKPCTARQLATKMCRAGWVSVRRLERGEPRRQTMSTSARVCAEILALFELPAQVVMSRYAGTVGAECWTNEEGRELLLFIQFTARVLRLGNPQAARELLSKPDTMSEYRALLNLGATPTTLATLLDNFNHRQQSRSRKRGQPRTASQRRTSLAYIADAIAAESR